MASPTYAELIAQWKQLVKLANETYKFGHANSPNYLTVKDTLEQALEGDYTAQIAQAANNGAAALSNVISSLQPAFNAWMLQFAKLTTEPSSNADAILRAAYRYFVDNTKTFVTRDITRGAMATGGTNTGTGVVPVVLVDSENYAIEDFIGYTAATNYVTRFECIRDQWSGAQAGGEVFRVRMSAQPPNESYPEIDNTAGMASEIEVNALSKEDADGLIVNSGFTRYTSGGTHPWDGWVHSAGAGNYAAWTQDTSTAQAKFLPLRSSLFAQGGRTYAALAIAPTASGALMQYIRGVSPRVPYLIGVRFRGDASADGNMKLSVGNYGTTVLTATAAVSTTYQTLVLSASTARQAWPERFMQPNLSVAIERDSHTVGVVYVDAVFFVPMDYFNGRWFKIISGGNTNSPVFFQRASTGTPNDPPDFFTATDTCAGVATQGSSQYWFNRMFPGYFLPHAASGAASDADYT